MNSSAPKLDFFNRDGGIQPILIELLMGHAGSGLVHTYAKADDDFKRDAAAKLEAFIASKISADNSSTTSTTWVN